MAEGQGALQSLLTATYSKMSSSSLRNMICFCELPKGQKRSSPGTTSRVSACSLATYSAMQ